MAHVLAAVPGPGILAMVDPGAAPPSRFPLTPVSTQIPDPQHVYTLPRTWPAYVQLGAKLPEAVRDAKLTAWAADELQARAGSALPPLAVDRLPRGLKPYSWQVAAAERFAAVGQAMLSDDPGTGKTISAILSVLERDALHQDALPCVVVCPASVRAAWVKAWQAWAPEVKVALYAGPKRSRVLGDPGTGARPTKVLVMSYEIMSRDDKHLAKYLGGTGTLILDEHHLIAKKDSARSKAARRLAPHAACRIVLSGTPITHHPGDLWPALNVLDPLSWPSSVRYVDRYCEQAPADYGMEIVGLAPARKVEFEVSLLGVQRRVAKADALQLPPKVYSVRTVEIPAEWRKVYDGMRDRMLAELPDSPGDISVMDTMTQITRLQQLAAAPADVWTEWVTQDDGTDKEKQHVKLKGPSWKVDALLEILAERPDQQVLVFSPSRQLIRLAEDAVQAAEIEYVTLVGGQTTKDREEGVQLFQDGKARVMLATTQAGGVGVTLTAASTVVFLGRPFSLVEALQAEDRAHRIGSERHQSIEIIDVLAEKTVDQAVRGVLRGKAATLAEVLRDPRVAAEVLGGIAS